MHGASTRRLPEHCDVIRVPAKYRNVPLHPEQRGHLVHEAAVSKQAA